MEVGERGGMTPSNPAGVRLESIVLGVGRSSTPARIIERAVGQVQDYDRAHRTELLGTLWAYLETGGRLQPTAAQLSVHQNTVKQRLG
jgi:DNA-binding PucR family transcriptional regulator